MKVQDRVTKALISIMRSPDWGFLGGVLKTGALESSDTVKTIATDGLNIYYNEEYISGLEDAQIQWCLLHEGLHKAYRHMSLWKNLIQLDKSRADKAMDYVINLEIQKSSTYLKPMPVYNALYDEKYDGMSTPEVFRLLEAEDSNNNDDQNGDGSGDGNNNQTHDEHLPDASQNNEQLLNDMDTAIRQAAGMLPSNRARELQNANAVKRDWKELLASEWSSTVPGKDDSSWSRVNPVYLSMGIYLPNTVKSSAKHVNFCIDTSGSISQEVLSKAAAEVSYLAVNYPPETLQVIWWDTEESVQVIQQEQYDSIKDILKPVGGGGTDPTCLDKHMVSETFNIVLTDGYFSKYSPKDPNTIFLIIEGGTKSYINSGTIIEM